MQSVFQPRFNHDSYKSKATAHVRVTSTFTDDLIPVEDVPHTKNELSRSRISKVVVWQTNKQTGAPPPKKKHAPRRYAGE